jgi:hypothetical protein
MDRSDVFWRIGIIAAAVLTIAAYLVVSAPMQTPLLPATIAGSVPNVEPLRPAPPAAEVLTAAPPEPQAAPARVELPLSAPVAGADLEILLDVLEELTTAGGTLPDPIDTLVRRDHDGRLVVASGTQRRYGPLVEALKEVDPDVVVTEIGRLEPSFVTADRTEGDLESRLRATMAALLAFKPPDVEPTMVASGPGWTFAEPEYDSLPAAERHLLLMGRRQARAVQSKLDEIRRAFGWPDPPVDRTLTMAAARPGPASATTVSGSDPATAIIQALPDPEP